MIVNRGIGEKRKFERVLFLLEENVSGVFTLLWKSREYISFTASIMNVSAGGLQFVLKRDDNKGFHVGDRLILKKIKGNEELAFFVNIELEIKWILETQYLEHMGVGCEFQNISSMTREEIDQFVGFGIESRCQHAQLGNNPPPFL